MSRFDHQPDDTRDPFTEQLSALLARTAESARPNPDLARQIRQRLSAGGQSSCAPRSFVVRHPALTSIGSIAVVALLLVAFAAVLLGRGVGHLRLGGYPGVATHGPTSKQQNCVNTAVFRLTPPSPKNPVDHSVALGVSTTSHGITATLDRVYADATGTTVTYHMTPDNNYPVAEAVLIDAAGAHYIALSEAASQQPDGHYEGVLMFAPLPQSELGSTQQLTFSLTGLIDDNAQVGEGVPFPTIHGPWNIPFGVTPVAGKAFPLTLPAQTHNGVTITLEEMDVAPAGGGLNGLDGGVRVRYRVSGLPSAMTLAAAVNYPYSLGVNSASAPGGEACYDTLLLTLASGQKLMPGALLPAGANAPASAADVHAEQKKTIGASGAVEVEAMFYTAIPVGKTTLTINTVTLSEMRGGTYTFLRNAQGPWTFTAALRN